MASLTDASGKQVPGLGAAAMQEGKAVAANILNDLAGKNRAPFTYDDRGTMATVGHNRAVAEIGKWKFSGFFAWILWSFVHIFLLIGFRNPFAVSAEWFWTYLRREGVKPLITEHQREGFVREPFKIEVPELVEIKVKPRVETTV